MASSPSLAIRAGLCGILLLGSPIYAHPANSECTRQGPPIGPNRRVASYRIAARLDPERHTVSGTAKVIWTNPSISPTSELYLHTYMNAFASLKTRFMRLAYNGRNAGATLSKYGNIAIRRLVAVSHGDVDLLPWLDRHSPSDPDDATDLRVALPFEVAPEATLVLEVEFETTLPSLFERAGFSRNFHAVAQWFPKLARRDRKGEWHHFAYDAVAEFSSDFGDYDVTLMLPRQYLVAAPGAPTTSTLEGEERIERYCSDDVHDFAWFAWDQFVVSESQEGSILLRHFASRDQNHNALATLDTARWGLRYYGSLYSAYPYPALTIVHPPDDARGASGMEYPQLITTGGPWYLRYLGFHSLDVVTLHELAHQWFYAVVASDEQRWPVLDEGLASWAEVDALKSRYGSASVLESPFLHLSEAAFRRVLARSASRRGPLASSAVAFGDFDRIAAQVYARFPTLLETISRVYAPATLRQALRAYVEAHRFSHPDPFDFLDSVQPHLPQAATAALKTALFENGWVDYAVRRIDTSPSTRGGYANRVLLERRGNFDFPVQLEVEFADGHVTRRHLESVGAVSWVEWHHVSPLVSATLDPDHQITIDDDLSNQTLRVGEWRFFGRLAAGLHLLFSSLWSLCWP